MAKVRFTKNLYRCFPNLQEGDVPGTNVREILDNLDNQYNGFRRYIVDDQGVLRKHVNIFVSGSLLRDRETLSDEASAETEIFFVQALSGG